MRFDRREKVILGASAAAALAAVYFAYEFLTEPVAPVTPTEAKVHRRSVTVRNTATGHTMKKPTRR